MQATWRKILVGGALGGIVVMGVAGWWIGGLFQRREAAPAPEVAAQPTTEPAKARVADLQADWSEKENPHAAAFGTWSYNQGKEPLDRVEKWAGILNGGEVNGWGSGANAWGNCLPFMMKVPENVNVPDLGTDLAPGDVIFHTTDPGNGGPNGAGNVAWKSPGTGSVTVGGKLWPTKRIGRHNTWRLDLVAEGMAKTLASGDLPEDESVSRTRPSEFKVAGVAVHEGDRLQLWVVRVAAGGNPYGDFAGVALVITEEEARPATRAAEMAGPVAGPGVAGGAGGGVPMWMLWVVMGLLGVITMALVAIVVLLWRRVGGGRAGGNG